MINNDICSIILQAHQSCVFIFQIRLTDMNDNAPIVSRARYVAYVRENESELEIPVQIDVSYFEQI